MQGITIVKRLLESAAERVRRRRMLVMVLSVLGIVLYFAYVPVRVRILIWERGRYPGGHIDVLWTPFLCLWDWLCLQTLLRRYTMNALGPSDKSETLLVSVPWLSSIMTGVGSRISARKEHWSRHWAVSPTPHVFGGS